MLPTEVDNLAMKYMDFFEIPLLWTCQLKVGKKC